MASYLEFVNAYSGRAIDYDGVYGAQCVDGFKIFCSWAGVPVKACPDGWAQSYWTHRDQLGYSQYFDYITNKNSVQPGDWCIWMKGSSNTYSHIAMYVGNGRYFGENQGRYNGAFNIVSCRSDWAGALRLKAWSKSSSKAPDQILTYNSKVKFNEFRIDDVDKDYSKNMVYSRAVGGWFSGSICRETTAADGACDQWVHIGSRCIIDGTFTVGPISNSDIASNIVYIKELGFKVNAGVLTEVQEGN